MKKFSLTKLLYKEDGEYIAHCPKFDIVGVSTLSFEEASAELNDLVKEYIRCAFENDDLGNLYRPAPVKVDACHLLATKVEAFRLTVPDV